MWGGYNQQGKLCGATRILVEVNPLSGIPVFWISAGGGDIARDELTAAFDHGIAILSIPARAKYPQDESAPFGRCKEFWDELEDYDTIGSGSYAWRRKRNNGVQRSKTEP